MSIASVREGKATTVVATSTVPGVADTIQYSTGHWPCLDAIRRHGTFRVQDLSTDPRWPAFAAQAVAELGVGSMLAHVLPVDDRALGAVNVYAMEPHAFRPEHEASSPSFGATAVGAMGVVTRSRSSTRKGRCTPAGTSGSPWES